MNIFKVVMRPVYSYTSALHSDTLFGAFCWAYKYKYGEEALLQMLKQYKQGSPAVIFSNGFPDGLLPFPMIPIAFRPDEEGTTKMQKLKRYRNQKKIKKLEYLTEENFNAVINGQIKVSKLGKNQQEVVNYGNLVNRITGTVGEDEDLGGLYERKEIYAKGSITMFAKVKHGWEDTFKEIMNMVCAMGIGADKSIGKGIFDIESIELYEKFEIPHQPDGFVTLSNYIPASDEPIHGYYKTTVKYGKLDREYAAVEKPFKKPLLMLCEGAVFYTKQVKPFYGRLVANVSNYNEDIVHSGLAFVLPIKITNLN